MTEHGRFTFVIMLVIGFNAIAMAMEDPADPSSSIVSSAVAEMFFLAVFGSEIVLKLFAQGVIRPPGAFFRGAWNW